MLSQGTSLKSRDRDGAGTAPVRPRLRLVSDNGVPPVSPEEIDKTWIAPAGNSKCGPTPGARVTWTKSGELIVDEPCGCYSRNGSTLRRCAPHAAYLRQRAAEAVALGALMVQMERS